MKRLSNTDQNNNKITGARVVQRVTSATTASAPTPNLSTTDHYNLTALAETATFGVPTGTPVEGDRLIIHIKDNGTARTLSWNAIYRSVGATLPTTTVISKNLYLGFFYNATDSRWDLLSLAQEA